MPDPDRVAQQRALLLLDAGRSRVEICEELRISDQQLTREHDQGVRKGMP
jgi:hypothetical protein